ncbi:MAG: hypothetical protein GY820_06255 [Gammaproteobacteria bacterium]|nr:hypothetical protein [Gammaproteobacteria bacterium]
MQQHPPILKNPQLETDSIKLIADTYTEAIQKEIPHCKNGQFKIIAYSSGAYIAKEMCLKLENENNQPSQLIIIDEPANSPMRNIKNYKFDNMLFDFLYTLQREMGNIFDVPSKKNIIWNTYKNSSNKEDKIHELFSIIIKHNINNSFPSQGMKKFIIISLRHVQFMLAAELKHNNTQKIKTDIHLFSSDSTIKKYKTNNNLNWDKTTNGSVISHAYNNTTHFNILQNENLITDINELLKPKEHNRTESKGMNHIKKLLNQMQDEIQKIQKDKNLTEKERDELSNFMKNIALNSNNEQKCLNRAHQNILKMLVNRQFNPLTKLHTIKYLVNYS